jgi:cytochrome c553
VLDDQNGELILPIVRGARADRGMPQIDLTDAQVSDIAAFLHSLHVTSHAAGENINIVVGDPRAGEAYFEQKCAGCHSATGDLKAIGARIPDPKVLQQTWLLPGGPGGRRSVPPPASYGLHIPPATVTVTLASGEKVEGKLVRIDDFYVGLTEPDGTNRGFRRDGDKPLVEIHDPVAPHKQLFKVYTDKDIHDVTAYLVTLK